MAKKLHPGAKWIFRFRAFWSIIFLSLFFGFWAVPFLAIFISETANIIAFVVSIIIIEIVLALIVIEVYARLSYRFWAYEFTKDQLKLERGIIWKRYSNVPYQRIQNVDITRGVIARICGFSTVNIQTAGYSAVASNGRAAFSEGYIPAVPMDEAEKIRDFVIKNISKRSQGL